MRNGDTVRMWYDPAAQILRYEWIEPADFYKPPNPLKGHDMLDNTRADRDELGAEQAKVKKLTARNETLADAANKHYHGERDLRVVVGRLQSQTRDYSGVISKKLDEIGEAFAAAVEERDLQGRANTLESTVAFFKHEANEQHERAKELADKNFTLQVAYDKMAQLVDRTVATMDSELAKRKAAHEQDTAWWEARVRYLNDKVQEQEVAAADTEELAIRNFDLNQKLSDLKRQLNTATNQILENAALAVTPMIQIKDTGCFEVVRPDPVAVAVAGWEKANKLLEEKANEMEGRAVDHWRAECAANRRINELEAELHKRDEADQFCHQSSGC